MRPPRLVPRTVLERVADEATDEEYLTPVSLSAALAVLVGAPPNDVHAGALALHELAKRVEARADVLWAIVDDPTSAPCDVGRVRSSLDGLRRTLTLVLDLAEAIDGGLHAVDPGGSPA